MSISTLYKGRDLFVADQILLHLKKIEELLYSFEVNKQTIQLSEVLNELKQIRILSIKADYYEMSKCVDFCFDKIKDWAEESTQWDHLQVQFLYMTVNMSKCLINPNHNCHEEKFAITSTKFNEPPVTQSLATEGLDLLDRSLKMIYMCLSMNNSSMSEEKLHDMEAYLKAELLHILKRKNSLKQRLHPSNSRSSIKAYA